jgi:Gpi18-like mannosyltransferase
MSNKNILRILLSIFLIRLALALLPSFHVDMGAWLAWAERLTTMGLARFYSDEVWTQYTPGFLYWLYFVGKLGLVTPLAIKIPVIICDMLTGYLIWKVVKKTNITWANILFVSYILSPIAIFDGSIWGQIDGILTLCMFLASYLLIEKNNYYVSWIVAGLAFLVKPQAIAIFPVLFVLTIARFGWKKMLGSGILSIVVVLIGFLPFYRTNPIYGMWDLVQKMGESYPYTSLFAFNIWGYFGMWQLDSALWMGQSYFVWGTIMMGMAYLLLLMRYRKYLAKNSEAYLLFALACLIFFLFPTRVHERYLFPMFAYLITYVGMKRSRWLLGITAVSMIIYLLNLYLPYSNYEQLSNPLKNIKLENIIQGLTPILSIFQIGVLIILGLFPTGNQPKNSIKVAMGKRETIEHG